MAFTKIIPNLAFKNIFLDEKYKEVFLIPTVEIPVMSLVQGM